MQTTFYCPSMETNIVEFVHKCIKCKRPKLHGGNRDYGLMTPRTSKAVNPFNIVHIDLIEPHEGGYFGITLIDKETRWLEVSVHSNKNSPTTAESFDSEWLCRNPRPRQVVHDQYL